LDNPIKKERGIDMTSETETRKEKVPWIPLAVLAVVLSFFTITSFTILMMLAGSWACAYSMGLVTRATCFAVWPYLMLILIYPIRKRFNVSDSLLVSLWAVGNAVSYVLGFGFVDWISWFPCGQLYDKLLSDLWWNVPVPAAKAMIAGHVATDWVLWGPSIFMWSLYYITFFFFTSSVVLIFRHVWLDVEQIPFPLALSGSEILKKVSLGPGGIGSKVGANSKPFYVNSFWIGFILAFVYEIPVFMARTFPWFPDIYGFRAACPSWSVHADAPESDIIASTLVGYTGYSKDVVTFAMALLVPLSISFNVWFWTIVMWILDQVAYATGSFTGMLTMGGSARMCCFDNSLGFTGPFRWNLMSMVGGFVALSVMQIYLHGGYLTTTIKAAIGKAKPEWEKNEVMSYRSTYIMLVLSIIAVIATLNLFGVDFMASFLLLAFTCFTTWLAMLMLFAYGAFGASDCRIWTAWPLRARWPEPPSEESLGFVMAGKFAFVGGNVVSYGFGNGMFITALNLKMSALTGTSNRNAFWSGAMAFVISVVVINVTRVWLLNTYGGAIAGANLTQASGLNCINYVYSLPSNSIYATYGAFGFIIVTILSVLHARFLWFPFEPVGFIIATSFGGFWNTIWTPFLVAWIFKTIVLRVGGSKLYSEWIVPSVGGFAAGVALGTLIGVLTGIFRFYVPF